MKVSLYRCQVNKFGWKIFPIVLLFMAAENLVAQEIEPRSYAVVPKGMHVTALSYTYSNGSVVVDQSAPVQDLSVTTSIIAAHYVSTFSFLKKLGRLQISVPYAMLSGTAKYQGVDTAGVRNGLGDARIKFGVNLLGSPVMSIKDFVRFREETVLGTSLVISVPIGQYDPNRLVNLGSNRWGFKPEIGFSHRQGRFFFEFYTGVWFFTTNNSFLGKNKLTEAPLFAFQAHVSYMFKSTIWIALNGGYAKGGKSDFNSTPLNDEQENLRLGGTLSIPFDKHQSVRFLVNTGVETHAGQNYTAFTIAYQYSWF